MVRFLLLSERRVVSLTKYLEVTWRGFGGAAVPPHQVRAAPHVSHAWLCSAVGGIAVGLPTAALPHVLPPGFPSPRGVQFWHFELNPRILLGVSYSFGFDLC